jgi:CRISPR system Cascade subunit CasC
MTNNYVGKKIEFHIIQSFPVSCLNRDDVGSPKSALIGGVPRARVSSQSWKRQVRMELHHLGVKIACRTKSVAERIASFAPEGEAEKVHNAAETIAKILATDTLYFFSDSEAKGLADFIIENNYLEGIDVSGKTFASKVFAAQKQAADKGFKNVDGLDIALFGRMVANAASLSVEAASSFAHAISTHKVSSELDFFTALDDEKNLDDDDARSAHLGTTEFNAATYYRYVSLDLGQLVETLGGDENLNEAVDAFIKALFIALPYARQSTMSGANPWDFARVYVRRGQRLQASFDNPVKARGDGFCKPSIEALRESLDTKEKTFGSLFGLIAKCEWGLDENYSIDNLINDVNCAIHED